MFLAQTGLEEFYVSFRYKVITCWLLSTLIFILFAVIEHKKIYIFFGFHLNTFAIIAFNRLIKGNANATYIFDMVLNVELVALCNILAALLFVKLFKIDITDSNVSWKVIITSIPTLLAGVIFMLKIKKIVRTSRPEDERSS
jgi:hypothetical protein